MLLMSTLGFTQNVGGSGVQPTEATNGEVSLDTLNIHLDIPLVNKTGVGMPLSFGLHYNSNVWGIDGSTWGSAAETPTANGWGSPGLQGSFIYGSLPVVSQVTCPNGPWEYTFEYYIDGSGNMHFFQPLKVTPNYACGNGSATAALTDGSGLVVNVYAVGGTVGGTVTLPNGTVITPLSFDNTSSSAVDVNGNTITDVNTTNSVVTDTLGVAELTNTWGCKAGNANATYSYPTSTGTATITVKCTAYTPRTLFQCSGVADYAAGGTVYLPTTIDLPDGSSYAFTYESQVANTTTGRIASITYPTGETVSYQYTGPNNGVNCNDGTAAGLTRTVSGDGVYTYSRNTTTWLTTTLVGPSPAGNTNVYTFSQQAGSPKAMFLTQSVENQGSSTPLRTRVYCYNGNQTSCATATAPTFPLTQTDVYTTLAGMSTSSRVSTTFDGYMNVTKRAVYDFGASTPTRQTVAGPYGYTWNGSTTSPTCTTAIGSGVNNKPCQVQLQNGSGTQLRNTYIQYGTTTNPGSLLSKAVLTSGSTYLTTSATYNANGTMAASFDVNGNKTTYTQGACNSGFVTKIVPPISTLDTQYTWDPGCNGAKMMSATDPNGFSVSATYNDPFWRATSKTDQLNNTMNISYGYSPLTVESQMTFGSSDFDVFNTADALGRPLYAQQIEGPGGSWDTSQMGYSWNTTGRATTKTMPCATTKGAGCSTATTTATHDALGRTLVVTDGGGGTITNTYTKQDVLTVLGPAPAGEVVKQVQKEYNGLGQLVSLCQLSSATGTTSCGQANGGTGYLTTYNYNADGTVASVVRGSQTHSFTYDAIGRTLTATYPESGTTTYVYDGTSCWSTPTKGLLTYKTDATGTTIMYSYDSLNRMIVKGSYGPNSDGLFTIYVYDSATVNGQLMQKTAGRLAEQVTGSGPSCSTVSTCLASMTRVTDEGFSYTAHGEISDVYESTPHSGGYYHTSASYFGNGALATLSDVANSIVWSYTVDGKGRPYSAIQNPSTNLVGSTTYNAADQPLVITLGLGDTDTYGYDTNTGRMLSYSFSVGATPITDAGTLVWNANGTLRSLSVVDGFNAGGTQTCNYGTSTAPGYDEQGRLASAVCANTSGTNVWGQQFTYDAFGNVTKSVPSGDTGIAWQPGYNQGNNQYQNGVTYDANGNLKNDTFNTYTWNQDNHPLTVNGGATNAYDASGTLVEIAGTTQRLVSAIGMIGTTSGSAVNEYRIPLPGGSTFNLRQNEGQAPNNLFWHKDWIGSSRLVSARLARAWEEDKAFAPFGEVYLSFDNLGYATEASFAGYVQDLLSGTATNALMDTPNRELSTTQGRWISPDPAHASWNAYAYTTNPLGETDPSGLSTGWYNTVGCATCGRVPWNLAIPTGGAGGGFVSESALAGLDNVYTINGVQVSSVFFNEVLSIGSGGALEFASSGHWEQGVASYDFGYVDSNSVGADGTIYVDVHWQAIGETLADPVWVPDGGVLLASAADLQRIQNTFNAAINRMNQSGQRRPGTGKINGWLNNLFSWWEGYQACTGQSFILLNSENAAANSLDDNWTFSLQDDFVHTWVLGTSSNPMDPSVTMDPLYNTFTPNLPTNP